MFEIDTPWPVLIKMIRLMHVPVPVWLTITNTVIEQLQLISLNLKNESASMDDAVAKLYKLVDTSHPNMGKISNWNDGTIDRIIDIMTGNGEKWKRDTVDYRKYSRESKY